MSEVKHGRGYVSAVQYHVVWGVKDRHNILTGEVESTLKEILHHIAQDNDFEISEMETGEDHIHLLIDCSPQHAIPNLIKALKGVSARLLFKDFPQLKNKLWDGHLWHPPYFVATVSGNTEEQMRHYIQNQKVRGKQCFDIKHSHSESTQTKIKRS